MSVATMIISISLYFESANTNTAVLTTMSEATMILSISLYLESANTNTAVLTTMSEAAKALKNAQENLDVDKVLFFKKYLK